MVCDVDSVGIKALKNLICTNHAAVWAGVDRTGQVKTKKRTEIIASHMNPIKAKPVMWSQAVSQVRPT